MAITDGTAGAGLAVGSSTRLGGRRIRVTEHAAVLDDGTLAGSTLTMDRAFSAIATTFGFSVADAAMLCATTPARELGMTGLGVIVEGGTADVVVLDRHFHVVRTFIGRPGSLSKWCRGVACPVLHAGGTEPVAPLAALAAAPAVAAVLRIHAGERQLQRHTKLDA